MLSNVERVLEESHRIGESALSIPHGWTVSRAVWNVWLNDDTIGGCPEELQRAVEEHLASVKDPEPSPEEESRLAEALL